MLPNLTCFASTRRVRSTLTAAILVMLTACGGGPSYEECQNDPSLLGCADGSSSDAGQTIWDGIQIWLSWTNDSSGSDPDIADAFIPVIHLGVQPEVLAVQTVVGQFPLSSNTVSLRLAPAWMASQLKLLPHDPQDLLASSHLVWKGAGLGEFQMSWRNTLPAGHYRTELSVDLCQDSACTRRYLGSPLHLPVQLDVVAP
jgi:hypothetical protein